MFPLGPPVDHDDHVVAFSRPMVDDVDHVVWVRGSVHESVFGEETQNSTGRDQAQQKRGAAHA